MRAKVNDIVAARDRDSFSDPWRRVLLKKVSKTTWLLLDDKGKVHDEADCPCSGFTEESLLEEAGMDYYDFPFDDVPPCATSPSATNDGKDEDDALFAAVDAFVSANGAKAAAATITTAAAATSTTTAAVDVHGTTVAQPANTAASLGGDHADAADGAAADGVAAGDADGAAAGGAGGGAHGTAPDKNDNDSGNGGEGGHENDGGGGVGAGGAVSLLMACPRLS